MATACQGKTKVEYWKHLPRAEQKYAPCPYPARQGDVFCGRHRRGRSRSEAAGRAVLTPRQAAYVRAWRADHTGDVYGDVWVCPLCGWAYNSTLAAESSVVVALHQQAHGQDWLAMQAAGARLAPDAGDGGDQ